MAVTCGFVGQHLAAHNKAAGQSMINCVRGRIDPIPPPKPLPVHAEVPVGAHQSGSERGASAILSRGGFVSNWIRREVL